jgi:hypothetical protein
MSQPGNGATQTYVDAASLLYFLLGGGRMAAVEAPALRLEPGEYPVAVLSARTGNGLNFERCLGASVTYSAPGGFAVGSPQFVAGFAVGTVLQRTYARHKAYKFSMPQWRPFPLCCTVVTTRRLWCEVTEGAGANWLNFDYDAVASLDLNDHALAIGFHPDTQAAPLRLTGAWAPWCAVVVAYHRFGPAAANVLPRLRAGRSA